MATQGYGTVGRRGHPETTTAAGDFRAAGLSSESAPLPGSPGVWVGSELSVREDGLPGFLGRPLDISKSDD